MDEARERLAQGLKDPETAAEVVSEMIADLKALVVTARLGHHGVMDLLNEQWRQRMDDVSKGLVK